MAFVATMLFALLAANVASMWVAIEATTIVTAFLVGHRRTRASLEASWKYVIIGSVGIILAFLGTILLGARGPPRRARAARIRSTGKPSSSVRGAPRSRRRQARASALLVLGYGTKVGLAPMHTWLPDAH